LPSPAGKAVAGRDVIVTRQMGMSAFIDGSVLLEQAADQWERAGRLT